MSLIRIAAAVVLVPFAIYSTWATIRTGPLAYVTGPFTNPAWLQEFLDLTICLGLLQVWMIVDGRKRGATVWPYVVLTPVFGSMAALVYLILRREDKAHSTLG